MANSNLRVLINDEPKLKRQKRVNKMQKEAYLDKIIRVHSPEVLSKLKPPVFDEDPKHKLNFFKKGLFLFYTLKKML